MLHVSQWRRPGIRRPAHIKLAFSGRRSRSLDVPYKNANPGMPLITACLPRLEFPAEDKPDSDTTQGNDVRTFLGIFLKTDHRVLRGVRQFGASQIALVSLGGHALRGRGGLRLRITRILSTSIHFLTFQTVQCQFFTHN